MLIIIETTILYDCQNFYFACVDVLFLFVIAIRRFLRAFSACFFNLWFVLVLCVGSWLFICPVYSAKKILTRRLISGSVCFCLHFDMMSIWFGFLGGSVGYS